MNTNGLLNQKQVLEKRIIEGEPAPANPDHLTWEDIEVIPQVFQHREDSQWISNDHIRTLVKALKNSTKAAQKKPLEPLTIFWSGTSWVLIDGHHRLKAYKEIKFADPVPVQVFSGSLDQAIAYALKGNSKDKLPMSKSEKTNGAWRLVISTGLSLSQLADVSTISKPTIVLMRKVMRHLRESDDSIDLDDLTWQVALRKYQGKEDQGFEPDHEWRNKRVAEVAQKLGDTFGGVFKRRPEVFWDAVAMYDSALIDYFLSMHGIDAEDFKSYQTLPTDF